jgi:pyruvate dehydrogenase E2 component (dihydrolipoamide acetyltransferase)
MIDRRRASDLYGGLDFDPGIRSRRKGRVAGQGQIEGRIVMVQIVSMPKLGQTVEESTVVKWHKQPGDQVAKGEIIFEIETDKAVLEIESFFEGTLLKIIVPEGATVPVTAPVAFIGTPGEPLPELPPLPAKPKPEEAAVPAGPVAAAPVQSAAIPAASAAPPASRKKIISPRARRLLKKHPVNPDPIPGTGPGGRITEKDVLGYLAASGYSRLRLTPAAKALALKEGIDVLSLEPAADRITLETIKEAAAEKPREMSKIRQIIARRLTQSFTSVPHFYVSVSADVTELVNFRKELKKAGKPYSITDFILKSSALALVQFPEVNSTTDGRTVRWHRRVHLGLAVAVKEGLVVPVIRNADTISLDALHAQCLSLAQKARDGKLLPDEMTGSTFTISNMGMLDVDDFTAIINPGESAILAVASIRETPVVRKGQIVIRALMGLTLSADHRLVDGALAAQFINQVKSQLEDLPLWKNMISQ